MSREQERIRKKLENNPIVECNKIQKKYCPELFSMFGEVADPRHQCYIKYSSRTMLGTLYYKSIAGISSMQEMTRAFNNEKVCKNLYGFEVEKQINEKLHQSSILELRFQYALWKKDYKAAFNLACDIVEKLNAPSLSGYKCFWNYMVGCMAYYLFRDGQAKYKISGVQYLSDALKGNISIRWLSGLPEKLFSVESRAEEENDFFFDCIEQIENIFKSIPTAKKLEKRIQRILESLRSLDGKVFERGHKELGELLGYISENPESTGAPDPYWIINENNIIVSEDKIYEEKEQVKNVPISDVSEAGRHQAWIIEHEKRISRSAKIYTVLITNSRHIDEEACIYANNIYYVYREDYVNWAVKALTVIRSVWNTFTEEGEILWREAVHQEFINAGITPKSYLDFVCGQKLKDML